jgi:hypothetical protein
MLEGCDGKRKAQKEEGEGQKPDLLTSQFSLGPAQPWPNISSRNCLAVCSSHLIRKPRPVLGMGSIATVGTGGTGTGNLWPTSSNPVGLPTYVTGVCLSRGWDCGADPVTSAKHLTLDHKTPKSF